MAKRILTLCLALVIGIAFSMPAAAAVKSIKVGGDLTIRGIYRDNLDFNKSESDSNEAWTMTATRIMIGAELTDNVSAVVRIINEKDWGNSAVQTVGGALGIAGLPLNTSQGIDIDLAYVKMKDLFFPGFSATLGRQEILLGKGLVVGNANGLIPALTANTAIRAADMTARKSFDAWRFDYEAGVIPLTLTLFNAKIIEENANLLQNTIMFLIGSPWDSLFAGADLNLMGLNAALKLDSATIEAYILNLNMNVPDFVYTIPIPLIHGDINIYTYGARLDHNVMAMPGLNYNVEAALQRGKLLALDQDAWMGNADISYTFQNPMQPKIGASWLYNGGGEIKLSMTKNRNWIPTFPENMANRVGRIAYADLNGIAGTNSSIPKVYGSFKPAEKHLISLAWFPGSTLTSVPAGNKDELGSEVDLGYAYQYTEDVSFGLCVDYATAGAAVKDFVKPVNFSDNALQIVGTVALSF